MFTGFETYSLSWAVPALGLPALECPTEAELVQRAYDISYDIIRDTEGERGLVALLQKLSAA